MGKWISVESSYPNDGQEVIVLRADGSVRIALHTIMLGLKGTGEVHFFFFFFTGGIQHVDGVEFRCEDFEDITHWTELPTSPKDFK